MLKKKLVIQQINGFYLFLIQNVLYLYKKKILWVG